MPPPERSPRLTADIIIQMDGDPRRIVLVKRKFPPPGWAIPGGFVDWGETVEAAAMREAKEETGLDVEIARQFHVYSDPARDPRGHTVAVVFIARAAGEPAGGDDAAEARIFTPEDLPAEIAFDHRAILDAYFNERY
jgi:ADP-ribose pyrophosphatase YjhB (NUDIX family)